jgi:hypothetical protein
MTKCVLFAQSRCLLNKSFTAKNACLQGPQKLTQRRKETHIIGAILDGNPASRISAFLGGRTPVTQNDLQLEYFWLCWHLEHFDPLLKALNNLDIEKSIYNQSVTLIKYSTMLQSIYRFSLLVLQRTKFMN